MLGERLRVAGLRADDRRGRGTGELLVTLPHKSAAEGEDRAAGFERVHRAGLAEFTAKFGGAAAEAAT